MYVYICMYVCMYIYMYILACSRRYPSTMAFSGPAVWSHLQKFWINFVAMASSRHWNGSFGGQTASSWPWNGSLGGQMASSWPWNGVLDGQTASSWPWNGVLGDHTAFCWPWNGVLWPWSGVFLVLERRLGALATEKSFRFL